MVMMTPGKRGAREEIERSVFTGEICSSAGLRGILIEERRSNVPCWG